MCLAIPGELLERSVDGAGFPSGSVSFGGVKRIVSLLCVPEARVGDYVLVHAGFAIHTIDEEEAATLAEYCELLGDSDPEPTGDLGSNAEPLR